MSLLAIHYINTLTGFDSEQLKPPSSTLLSAPHPQALRNKKRPDHQQVHQKLSYFSKTIWSFTIFLFSQINIYERGLKSAFSQRTFVKAGSRRP